MVSVYIVYKTTKYALQIVFNSLVNKSNIYINEQLKSITTNMAIIIANLAW